MTSRQITIIIAGLGILGLSFFLMQFLASQKEDPEKKPSEISKQYVRTKPVAYSDIETEVTAFGRVRTAESLDMIAEVSGRVLRSRVPLKEGQAFNKGALIFRIDNTEAKLNLQAQKSNFLKDLAAILPDLKIDFSDNYEAWEAYFKSVELEGALPKLPLYKSDKEKVFLATKNIFSSYYNIKSAEANLRKYNFYAPFKGSISSLNLQSGSFVNPGSNIGRIIRSGDLELKVDVGINDISWIQKGEKAIVTSEDSRSQWNAVVTRIGDFVNQNTQSIDVYLAIEPNKNAIYDGQYLKAAIPAKTVKGGMVMPRSAIINNSEVFVLEDTLLKVKQVQIQKLQKETAIFSGLPEGDELVVEPLVNAHNNMVAFKLKGKNGGEIDVETKKGGSTKLVTN